MPTLKPSRGRGPQGPRVPVAIAVGFALVLEGSTGAAPLTRDPNSFFAIGFQRMLLKDLSLEAPSCNLGVNCADTGRKCGQLNARGASMSEPGQIAGDDTCAPGTFWEVFRNNTSAACPPTCGMIGEPGPGPNCENTFDLPLLEDLDGDGEPSCDDACNIDVGDVAAACGAPYPLPPCDAARAVRADVNEDCSPAELDVNPGNMQCDLAPGTYGNVRVRNRARLNFGIGTTVVCGLAAGKATRVASTGPALILIPGSGRASFNNLSDVGGGCREFKLVAEEGDVRFARHGEFHLDACTLKGTMRLGHDNYLRGRFFSGEYLISDYNNTGACCGVTTTSTSTSSTSSTSTSTSSSSTTSTTETTVSSVTTTSTTSSTSSTIPGVCCDYKDQTPWVCSSAPTAQACIDSGGVPGDASDTCRVGRTETRHRGENGLCDDGPAVPGGCCELTDRCTIGGPGSEGSDCVAMGGVFNPAAECQVDGRCVTITTTSTTLPPTTTSTTLPRGAFTRVLGFYKTHPDVTQAILTEAGGLTVCGVTLTNVDLGSRHSAIEALCIAPSGSQRIQLHRQLIAARLTMAAGGALFSNFDSCNALCTSATGTIWENSGCINALDAFNNSGDSIPAPFDGDELGSTQFCQMAFNTPCSVLTPSGCID